MDLSTGRWMHSATTFDGKIFVFGGAQSLSDPVLNSVEVYDPKSNTWSDCSNMPTARSHLTTSMIDGKIYAIGGTSGPPSWPGLSTVEIYDPLTDSWTKGTDMSESRLECHSSVVNNKIYVFGGLDDKWKGLKRVEVYDPVTDDWSSCTDMPTARGAPSTVEVNNLIYVLGGIPAAGTGKPAVKTVEVYNPRTDSWSQQVEMPKGCSHFGANVFKGMIYTIGGSPADSDSIFSEVNAFNISKKIWFSAPQMSIRRHAHTTNIINGKIYAVGGSNTGPDWPGLTSVETFKIK